MRFVAWCKRNNNGLRLMSGILIVAALAVTLNNTSQFAMWFEDSPALSWAFAIYVDVAIIGYTLTRANNTHSQDKTINFAFWWFIALSLIANVLVTSNRYDIARMSSMVQAWRQSDLFMLVACTLYGASIPISVYTFAHTIAARGQVTMEEVKVETKIEAAKEYIKRNPTAKAKSVAQKLGVSPATVTKARKAVGNAS